MSIASCTSPPASAFTFPISCVIRSVSAAFSRSRMCAKRKRISPRFGAGTSRHRSRAAAVADRPLLVELAGRLARATVGALAAVDDDRHVRVVLVVVDHLVVELVGQLARDHAIDHALIVGAWPEK